MLKRTIVSSVVVSAIVVGALAAAVQPSAAGPHWHHGHHGHAAEAIGFGLGGFLLGSALAQPRVVVVDEYGGGHVRRCLDRYRTYDPDSDTFVGFDGNRHYCRL